MISISMERAMVQQMLLDRYPQSKHTSLTQYGQPRLYNLWDLILLVAGRHAADVFKQAFGNDEPVPEGFHKSTGTYSSKGIGPYSAIVRFGQDEAKNYHAENGGLFDYATYLLHAGVDVDEEAAPALRLYAEQSDPYLLSASHNFWTGSSGPYCPTIPEQYPNLNLQRIGWPVEETRSGTPQNIVAHTRHQVPPVPLDFRRIGWLDRACIDRAVKLVTASNIDKLHMCSVIHEGYFNEEVSRRARMLLNAESRAQPNYRDLRDLVQLVSYDFLKKWMKKGVRNALYVTHPDSPPKAMARGIKTLMSSEAASEHLIRCFGRPLEPEDVTSIRSPGVVELLWKLPFEIIKPLVDDTKVLARLMPHVGEVDGTLLRQCLSDHPGRGEWKRPLTDPVRIQAVLDVDNWYKEAEKVAKRYQDAKDLRADVIRICGDIYRGILVTYPIVNPEEQAGNIDRILGRLSAEEWELRRTFADRWFKLV